MMSVATSFTMSLCNTAKGYLPHESEDGWLGRSASTTLDHAINYLVTCETLDRHYIWHQSEFLSALQGENVHRGQPRDIERYKVRERGREREQTKVEEEEIRGKINVTRTRELY